jgi:hypothetical protein
MDSIGVKRCPRYRLSEQMLTNPNGANLPNSVDVATADLASALLPAGLTELTPAERQKRAQLEGQFTAAAPEVVLLEAVPLLRSFKEGSFTATRTAPGESTAAWNWG